jgi:hypothetical protein
MTTCKECVARMLGACHGDFCDMERTGLIEQVERVALDGGHVLGPFEKARGRPMWRAVCTHCGLAITYTLDPDPGGSAIYGPLLYSSCTG